MDVINLKKIHFDVSDYDCLVFDEILLHAPEALSRIGKFIQIKHLLQREILTNYLVCHLILIMLKTKINI